MNDDEQRTGADFPDPDYFSFVLGARRVTELDDGFARGGIFAFPEEIPELNDDFFKSKIARFGQYKRWCQPTLARAQMRAEALGLDFFDFEAGSYIQEKMGPDFSERRKNAIENLEEFSEDWYLLMIYERASQVFRDEKMIFDGSYHMTDYAHVRLMLNALPLGALCREYELSMQHKEIAARGRLDAQRRSDGGKSRARHDRDAIISSMAERIQRGKSVRQAAREAHAIDKLGKNENANIGVWNRRPKNR